MAIQIFGDHATLMIVNGEATLYIQKNKIKRVDVIKDELIRLDLGTSDLEDYFIPYADVTFPLLDNAGDLRDAINAMLAIAPAAPFPPDYARECQQVNILNVLNTVSATLDAIKGFVISIEAGIFDTPLRVDYESESVSYRGFAAPGSLTDNPVWAIQKTTHTTTGEKVTWANGSKSLTNIWNDRATITYL